MKLAELHSDLKIQERDELNWKKLKAEGLDKDGEKEAKLVHNLNGTFLFSGGCSPQVKMKEGQIGTSSTHPPCP